MKAWNNFIAQRSNAEKWYLGTLLLVFIHNLFLPVMEIDSMQYAGMAKEMSQTGNYLQVHEFGRDYLDKPPLLFWLSSISMKIFGVHFWSFRLPNFICLLLGLWATYRFALLYYSEQVAKDAFIVLASSMAFFQMVHDVRTDGLLMSFTILGIWKFSDYLLTTNKKSFLWGSFFTAMAMLAKGPIGLLAVFIPIMLNLLVKKQWKKIFNPRWLLALLVILVFLAPMLWGLYQQFDLHPEKEVYGLSGPSGIEFYFWTQSFGRITGDIYWDNGMPWSFFFGSMAWDFSPWYLLFVPAWVWAFAKFRSLKEYTSLLGFTVVFLMMSASRFKLPHYVFVVFPLASVMVAVYVSHLGSNWKKKFSYFFMILAAIILAALWIIPTQFFPPLDFAYLGAWLVGLSFYFRALRIQDINRLIPRIALALFSLPLVLSFDFYPKVFKYQLNNTAAEIIAKGYNASPVYTYYHRRHAIDFETDEPYNLDGPRELKEKNAEYILTHPSHISELNLYYHLDTIKMYTGYPVSRINLKFLNKSTRQESLNDTLLFLHLDPLK